MKKGDLLGTVDLDAVKQAGFDPTVMMIITNTNDYEAVEVIDTLSVDENQDLLALSVRYEN